MIVEFYTIIELYFEREHKQRNNKIMNKTLVSTVMLLAVTAAQAQVTVPEPEFIHSVYVLTSDSTCEALPGETGTIGEHQTKAKNALKVVGKVASVATAVGGLGTALGAHTGNIGGALAGLQAMETASSIANVADKASFLAGSVGMDIIFDNNESSYACKMEGDDVRVVVKGYDNESDPMGVYRVVRFNIFKNQRRIQWIEWVPDLLGTEDAKKSGFLPFSGHKYGEQSYLLTIPADELTPGEYGIIILNCPTQVPVATFSVK